MIVRRYEVRVSGFDFDHVFVMAHCQGRARSLVAHAYADAGWGSWMDGMRHIRSCRIDIGPGRELASSRRGNEGLCRSLP